MAQTTIKVAGNRYANPNTMDDTGEKGTNYVAFMQACQDMFTELYTLVSGISAAELGFLDGVTAGTAAASKALVLDANGGISPFRGGVNAGSQGAPTAKTTSATLTAAELITGIITGNQGGGAGASYQLPLASAFDTAMLTRYPGLQVDDSFTFSVINISTVAAEVITITTNTNWTLVGDMTLAANATGDQSGGLFRARRTAADTYTLYRIA